MCSLTAPRVRNYLFQVNKNSTQAPLSSDLTMPLILPKINSRPLIGVAANQKSDTIPLNIPKGKNKSLPTDSSQSSSDGEKLIGGSVLRSLTEEDLIRKAAEMLGESEPQAIRKTLGIDVPAYSPAYPPPSLGQFSTPPPPIVIPPPAILSQKQPPPIKKSMLEINQPPIPGLEND